MSKEFSCKFCGRVFTNKGIGGHTKMCSLNPDREKSLRSLEIARQSITQESRKKVSESLRKSWSQGVYADAVKKRIGIPRKKLSVTARQNIANGRRKWLAENPEKHPWLLKTDRYHSHPCEIFKETLRCKSIEFVEEYKPLEDRYFSIDIAFPAIKLGIEINGGQHYGLGGILKEYYQIRHDAIEAAGWKLYEIPHRACYNDAKLSEIIDSINLTHDLADIDWVNFIPQKTKRQRSFEAKVFRAAQAEQQERILLEKWKNTIETVDVTKIGFVSKLAQMMCCSHTQVRRVLNRDFPTLTTFQRKAIQNS